ACLASAQGSGPPCFVEFAAVDPGHRPGHAAAHRSGRGRRASGRPRGRSLLVRAAKWLSASGWPVRWLYSPPSATISGPRRHGKGGRMAGSQKAFEIKAQWDGEAGVWWCSNDELPLTTEAPTFEELVARVLE